MFGWHLQRCQHAVLCWRRAHYCTKLAFVKTKSKLYTSANSTSLQKHTKQIYEVCVFDFLFTNQFLWRHL